MDDWDPELYDRFRRYRAEPVEELLRRLELSERERIVDLGCGSGENTVVLARRSRYATALGIDNSPAMIDRANRLRDTLDPELKARTQFALGNVVDLPGHGEYTVVFSNAALHWLPDHGGIFRRCYEALAPGGKMVVQMPANEEETGKLTIRKLAHEEPWRSKLGGVDGSSLIVPPPEHYRELLRSIGFVAADCYYRTFAHPLNHPAEVAEWYRSTGLRPILEALPKAEHARFLDELKDRLKAAYGTDGPIVFRFRRLFLWARRLV